MKIKNEVYTHGFPGHVSRKKYFNNQIVDRKTYSLKSRINYNIKAENKKAENKRKVKSEKAVDNPGAEVQLAVFVARSICDPNFRTVANVDARRSPEQFLKY